MILSSFARWMSLRSLASNILKVNRTTDAALPYAALFFSGVGYGTGGLCTR